MAIRVLSQQKRVKVHRVGGSIAVTLPRDMARRAGIGEQDHVLVVQTPDGLLVTKIDSELGELLEHYHPDAPDYRQILTRLNKIFG